MADNSKKKEKHRLKRLKKQKEMRKNTAITPLRQLATGDGKLECWVNSNWEKQGIASLMVFGTTTRGRTVSANFLVDVWCVGLKDVYGAMNPIRVETEKRMREGARGLTMTTLSVDEARRLVAGGIRFSRQNGFRLPPDWEKWTAIFGGLGDINSADLSGFGKDGGLMFVGEESFLRRRLIGCTPEEFFAREGNHYLMEAGIGGDDIEEDEYDEFEGDFDDDGETEGEEETAKWMDQLGEATAKMKAKLIDRANRRCAAKGIQPHPLLDEAGTLMASTLVASTATAEPSKGADMLSKEFPKRFERVLASHNHPDLEGMAEASAQILLTFSNEGAELLEAAGAIADVKS